VAVPYKLLIVEDDPETSAMLRKYFDLHHFKVRVAALGQEAIEQCLEKKPDLILLDIQLPDIDGYQVLARLQREVGLRRVPVIFVTQRQDRNSKISGLQMGAADFITKPFDLEELLLRVRNVLQQTDQWLTQYPIVEVPLGEAVQAQLRSLAGKADGAALWLRLRNLDDQTSDRVLRAASYALHEAATERNDAQDSVVHLDKTDFAVITSAQRLESLLTSVKIRLSRALRSFVPASAEDVPVDGSDSPTLSVTIGVWRATAPGPRAHRD
jgi:DNA-binding response OmpR family regulator